MSDIEKNNEFNVWKSLGQYNNEPASVKAKQDEFMEGVTDDFNPDKMPAMSRRKFVALLSASAALTATACSDYRDKGEIVPYTKRPEEVLPGKANYYASTCNGCSQACGTLIKTREGRPIKVDGNPDHPVNQGKICAKGQADILNLYDPERLKNPLATKADTDWATIDKIIINELADAASTGKEIAIVTQNIKSPTALKLFDDFKKKYPTAKIYSYDIFNNENRRRAWSKSYNTSFLPTVKWNEIKVVLALESDFLGNDGSTMETIRLFTSGRDIMKTKDFNRLYVAEGGMSLTGMNGDYRFRVRPDAQFEFVMSILNEIVSRDEGLFNLPEIFLARLNTYALSDFIQRNGLDDKKIHLMVDDLISRKGEGFVYAGDTLNEEVHIAVNLLNEILGNTSFYNFEKENIKLGYLMPHSDLAEFINNMKVGNVGVVIHYDSNPAFQLPASYKYASALENVKTKISLTEALNDTSDLCDFVLPANHQLESWGDAQVRNDVYSLQQPVIAPIFNTRQKESVLLHWLSGNSASFNEDNYHQYLMNNFRETIYNQQNPAVDFDSYWYASLHGGVVKLKTSGINKPSFKMNSILSLNNKIAKTDYLLQLKDNYFIGDGKFANNGWLQELPHPVSKVTWDNYAAVSPATAKELNVNNDDLLQIKGNGKEVILPVYIQPGQTNKVITVELGYGRKIIGDVGKDVGVDVNSTLNSLGSNSPLLIDEIAVEKVAGTHKLVSTQEHHSLDDEFVKDFHRKRKIIQEGTVTEYNKNPHFLHEEKHDVFSITGDREYKGNKWAMSIDLNKCISCSVCVASCNVENNIAVVGKDQVAKGREMQWMRIDRYYSGTPDEPIPSNQPMLCQHCDNAPCENVCPVNATNHSPDGLNQMVYNRCVGTRYCSNNCPYKVRRFNFFNFRDHFEDAYYENELTSLANNPEVTVRSRGVMEKCTFCVQRIMEARSEAIKEGRPLKGSDVTTACQQACPSQAIVFGDANEKDSEIAKYREHELGYHVLEETNVRPNVTYLAKLRNTHTEEF